MFQGIGQWSLLNFARGGFAPVSNGFTPYALGQGFPGFSGFNPLGSFGLNGLWGGTTPSAGLNNGFGFPGFSLGFGHSPFQLGGLPPFSTIAQYGFGNFLPGFNPGQFGGFPTGGFSSIGGTSTSSTQTTRPDPKTLSKTDIAKALLAPLGSRPVSYQGLSNTTENQQLKKLLQNTLEALPKQTLDKLYTAGYKIFLVDLVDEEVGLAGRTNLKRNEIYIAKHRLVPTTEGTTPPKEKVLNPESGLDDLLRHEIGHGLHDLIYQQLEKATLAELAKANVPTAERTRLNTLIKELQYQNGIRMEMVDAFSPFLTSQSREKEQIPPDALNSIEPGIANVVNHLMETPYELFAEMANILLDRNNQADVRLRRFIETHFPESLQEVKTLLERRGLIDTAV